LLWRRLREDPLKGLPEELRLRRRMFRERLRKGLLEASRKRLREAPRERLREARRKGLQEARRKGSSHEGLQKEPRNWLPDELQLLRRMSRERLREGLRE
jgi:hypothetical protein